MSYRLSYLLLSGVFMVVQGQPHKPSSPPPSKIELAGPNGSEIVFTRPELFLYRCAKVIRPGRAPVQIHLAPDAASSTTLVDGADARGNNFLFAARLHRDLPWSLALWSLDGGYVVLTTFDLNDGKVDVRNTRSVDAYDTTTGEMVEFAGKTSLLSADTFVKWSPTIPGTALLRGPASTLEEARLKQ